MCITWILFDQAGVQTFPLFSTQQSYSINGVRITSRVLQTIWEHPAHRKYNRGEISEHEFVTAFLNDKQINLTSRQFIRLMRAQITPIPGVKEVLERLKRNGYHLATIINEGKEWADYKFKVTGYRRFFDHIFVSGRMGLAKPDVAFYELALKTIHAKPQECVFIDDQQKNVDAAKKLGIRSILFKNAKALEESLAKYNVHI